METFLSFTIHEEPYHCRYVAVMELDDE
jgi:hypothetical protein